VSEGITILVIEDDRHIRTILEYNLRQEGFDVYSAADGASGLEMALEKMPRLILLDWMMPRMNGLEVLEKLKGDEKTRNIPVFMLTARGMLNDADKALNAGADGYITKPFNPVELGKTVREKLRVAAGM
jgi:two-component system phosphate regulon response regulator PhoB